MIIIIIIIIIKFIQGNITNELITTTSFKIKDNYNNQGGWGGGGEGNSIDFHPSFFTHSACQYDVT